MRRLGSLFVLVGLLGLPPVLLLQLGFYDWARLNLWAPADYRILLAILTVAAWAAWLVFVLSVVLEALRIVTSGRVTIRLPGLGLPQAFAGLLLAGVLATTVGPAATAVAAPPPTAPVTSVAVAAQPAAAPAAEEAPPAPAPATAAADAAVADSDTIVHVVDQRDDLWSLAEKYFGSGTQWRKIVAANPDVLAADPMADLPVGTPLAIVNPIESYKIQRGDTLWHLAEERLGDGQRYREIQQLNADQISDPDYIEAGWTIQVPAAPAASEPVETPPAPAPTVPTTTAPTSAPAAPPTSAPAVPAQPADQGPEEEVGPLDNLALRVALGGLGALAASGAVGRLVAHRRERAHARELGRTYPGPQAELQRIETALGLSGLGGTPDGPVPREFLVARAQRLLAAHWWATAQPAAGLRRVLVTPHAIYFEFTEPFGPQLPAAFQGTQSPHAIRAAWTDVEAAPEPDHAVAYPALVTLGRDVAGNFVLIDLVSWGVLSLEGDAEIPTASLSAMLVELTCSPWSAELTLSVASHDRAFVDAAASERVRCFDDVEAAVAELERRAAERRALLTVGGGDFAKLRLDPDLADAWAPYVALFELAPDADQLRRIRQALADGPGLGAIVAPGEAGEAGAAASEAGSLLDETSGHPRLWLTQPTPDAEPVATLQPVGLSVAAQTLQPAARDAITALFSAARSTETQAASWWRDPAEAAEEPGDLHDTIRVGADGGAPVDRPADRPGRADETLRPDERAGLDETLGADETVRAGALDGLDADRVGSATSVETAPVPEEPVAEAEVAEADEAADDVRTADETRPAPDEVNEADATLPVPQEGLAADLAEVDDATVGDRWWTAEGAEPAPPQTGPALDPDPADVETLRLLRVVSGPRLRLFGRVRLEGARGTAPAKAQRRCLEYCAWLLEHPGATASEMSRALFVSDGTRRSNVSRLRAWLGSSPDGELYLPEAYSGRIELQAGVTSDWLELQRLVDRGVNQASPERLRAALALVEGAPLADGAPGEWAWADLMRTRMAEAVRDVVVVLARAERERGALDAARDACIRGQLVVPDDELIGRERLLVEASAGNLEAAAAVLRTLEQSAADRGDDLSPETVELGQQLLEGRQRPQFRSTGSEG